MKALWQAWCKFFFEPSSTLPLCLFRILFGLVTLEAGFLLAPDVLTWYGIHGVMRLETARSLLGNLCLDLLLFLPQSDTTVIAFFSIFMLSALFVCLGLFTRISTIVLFLTLSSLHFRNPAIINSGDDLLRVYSFFMMFAPAGDRLSIDSLLRKKQKDSDHAEKLRSPWPQRLIQIEITLIYMQYFITKIIDPYWLDGTAVYYVLVSPELERFPIFFDRRNILLSQFLTYFTLIVEFALCALIWVREFRYWVLLSGVFLHLGLEYCLNIPIFQHIILSSYVLFVDPNDLEKIIAWVKLKFHAGAQREKGLAPQ